MTTTTNAAHLTARSFDMQTIEARIEALDNKLDTLNNNLLLLQGTIMPRTEVYTEDNKRVSMERFEGEMSAVRDRLARLEGGPQKMLGWISLLVSGGVGCLTLVIAALAVVASVLIAIIPHLH